ncbi:MAG: helix-turn-helix domain-containing protein [Kiritimatiellia bacterium]
MEAAKRAAAVGEVRRRLAEGQTLAQALAASGVSGTTYRRWAARLDAGGVAALADRPKSGRPAAVRLDEEEKKLLRRVYLQSNRAARTGSMTMAARIAARDPANCLQPATRAAILAERSSKHALPTEVRRAMREVAPAVFARYRDERAGQNDGIYVPGWLRRDEETGRLLKPGERQVWDDASVNVAVAVPWAGRGDKAGDRWGWRAARYQLLAGIDCATDFFCGFGYVMRTSDGYRACDVANVMHRVWRQQGFMPKKVVLEGGSWQAKPTLEFLRTAGVGVVSAKGRPNQKLVENYFNRLWTALSIFLPAYGQIGRYRGEMRRENLDWMKVQSGSADPRKHFPTLKTFLKALNQAVDYLRWERVESKTYGTWQPQEAYRDAAANGLQLVEGLERYALPVVARRQLRRGGMAFVTAETQLEGFRHEYAFATREGWRYDGAPVVVRFDPATAAARGAVIELAEGWRDCRAGTVIDAAAPCVSAPPDFLSETGLFDQRGAGRHEHAANRAAVRTVVTAYDTRGPVATQLEDGERTGFALRGGVPAAADANDAPDAADAPDARAIAALEAEERLMAYA